MRSRRGAIAMALLSALVISQNLLPAQAANASQTAPAAPTTPSQQPPPTPEELDQLLAPVALYPDSLLAQITTATTNPQEILDVDNWLQQNKELKGTALTDAAEKQGFDPAFIALVNFPQVLEMMAQHVDDYAAIGLAVTADQESVSASIQRLRSQAYASGALRSNEQQKIEVQQAGNQTTYIIQPASPQVVYVPQYDPTVVYVPGPTPGAVVTASAISFGAGIAIGALMVDRPWGWGGWGWNWGSRRVYYNRGVWGGWGRPYRSPRGWYRPRPVVYANRPGYRGNWGYRPRHYRAPGRAINRPGYSRPPYGPNNRPGYAGNRGVRQNVSRPAANRANRPATSRGATRQVQRPQNRPQSQQRPVRQNQRPSHARPAQRSRPAPRSNRPPGRKGPR